ncbi:MAG: hybrid sensor histidine kinase/response regulator [Microcoleaceae cyanobacterium]
MQQPTILSVDDEIFLLDSLRETLRRNFGQNYSIEIAETAEEALDIFEDLQEEGVDIPLIIADQIMPGMKGVDFLVNIHTQSPQTLQIMLTGQASVEDVGKAINSANLFHYIGKPWTEENLVTVVQNALQNYIRAQELADENQVLHYLNIDLEQQLAAQNIELQTAQRIAKLARQAKSNFLTLISHELRTPLNSILGFSQVLLSESEFSTEQKQFIQDIQSSGEQLLTLVNDLLMLTQPETQSSLQSGSPCDLAQCLDLIQEILQFRAERRGLDFQVEIASNLPKSIWIQEDRLRYVILQLVGSVVQLTQGNSVALKISQRSLHLGAFQDHSSDVNHLVFVIEADGSQILSEVLEDTLKPERLSQTKYSIDGNATGLLISYDLIRLMGGELVINSEASSGTVLCFEIPVQVISSAPPALNQPSNASQSATTKIEITEVKATDSSPNLPPVYSAEMLIQQYQPGLATMSSDWYQQLYEGARQCSEPLLEAVIQQLPPKHSQLANTLTHLVKSYRFDLIMQLTTLITNNQ